MEKAFDRVNRGLLYYKMLKLDIGGKVYQCIKDIYDGYKASINLNGHLTYAFATEYEVKQGDCLSPTLFSLFINDMADEIKSNYKCVSLGKFHIYIVYCMLMTLFSWRRRKKICSACLVLFYCGSGNGIWKSIPKNLMLYILAYRAMQKYPWIKILGWWYTHNIEI